MTPREPDLDLDLVIIGGGMVGAAFACAAADAGFTLAVVDGQPPARDWPAGEVDLRVSALSRASQTLLSGLGVWGRMAALGVSPYREMVVWDAVGGAEIRFDSAELGEPDLGHIVENRVTRLALWERLERTGGVHLLCPAGVDGLAFAADDPRGRPPAPARVTLTDGRVLQARLVVGADGRDSSVRAALGIDTVGLDYEQRAIVANVAVADWHRETAWQRFLPTGPLAFLPLRDGRCAIVWSADEARATELLALDEEAFRAALAEAFQQRLGPIGAIGPRAAFPLRRQHAVRYVRPRAALIGDAAHAIHPLAGQGVNLGFLDALALAEVLRQARTAGRDPGALGTLRRYERARHPDNALMLRAMDVFKLGFGNRNPALVVGRNLGLATAARLGPLRRAFMRRALGLAIRPDQGVGFGPG